MKRLFSLLLTMTALILIAGCSTSEPETTPKKADTTAVTLKEFGGDIVELKEFEGKKVYINFWASWCGPCLHEMPDLEEVYQANKAREDLTFISVTSPSDAEFGNSNPADGSQEEIQMTADDLGVTYPIYGDTKDSFAQQFGIRAFPTHLFLNPDGSIYKKFEGAISKKNLQQILDDWK